MAGPNKYAAVIPEMIEICGLLLVAFFVITCMFRFLLSVSVTLTIYYEASSKLDEDLVPMSGNILSFMMPP